MGKSNSLSAYGLAFRKTSQLRQASADNGQRKTALRTAVKRGNECRESIVVEVL